MVTVVNKYTHKPTGDDIYIGRGSVLGNPFTSMQTRTTKAVEVCANREESIGKYKEWIGTLIEEKDTIICGELNKIFLKARGGDVNLVCFCKPKQCHGDVIKELIEVKLNNKTWQTNLGGATLQGSGKEK